MICKNSNLILDTPIENNDLDNDSDKNKDNSLGRASRNINKSYTSNTRKNFMCYVFTTVSHMFTIYLPFMIHVYMYSIYE